MDANHRRNLLHETGEAWKPPLIRPGKSPFQRFADTARRFFDLQAGSIWADVAPEVRSASGRILDVGCGAGAFRSIAPAATEYFGIDTVEAKEHFGYDMTGVIYFSGKSWPIKDGSIDLVICTEVLEHVREPTEVMSEAYRCLRPGGRLLLTVPFSARWHFIPHDYWRYTPSGLRYLFESAGLEPVAVYARGGAVTVALYKAMALMLPFLFPQGRNRLSSWGRRSVGLLLAPLFVGLGVVANVALRCSRGGDDCLGYTAKATKPNAVSPAVSRPTVDAGSLS